MKVNRMDRVNELLKRELGQIFERIISTNTSALVTIVKVKTNPDLRQANVFVSIMGSTKQMREVMRMITLNHHHIQHEMVKRVRLKYTPKLTFRQDTTFADADNIEAILNDLGLGDIKQGMPEA